MYDRATQEAANAPDRRRADRWTILGTFLIGFALLSFEIATVRTINFTVGPSYIYCAIAFAMLGLSAAGSILSLADLGAIRVRRERLLFWGCLVIAVLLVITHLLAAESKIALNAALEAAGRKGGEISVVAALVGHSLPAAVKIGFVLSLPYFVFGALLSFLFATTPASGYGRLYAADLIGAAAGSVAAIAIMESTGYAFSVTAPAAVAALAAAAFATGWRPSRGAAGLAAAGLLCALPAFDWYADAVEPRSDPNFLIRDYDYRLQATEVWRGWNSFTRVGAVETPATHRPFAILSLANGDGMAWLLPYVEKREKPWRHAPTVAAMLLDPPKNALVMFAGAGADLLTLRENGAGKVTGVEINRRLVEGGLGLGKYRLRDMLADPNVHLEISEGRGFLERDSARYDLVLLSWSGATVAYYAGMLGGTTQFLFTYQGLSAVLDHLTGDGYAVMLQVNKVNSLAALRRYMDERGLPNPSRAAVVLFDPDDRARKWDGSWDGNPLLVKPSGWSQAEIDRIEANAATEGWRIAYAPGRPPHPDYEVYSRVLHAADVDAELAALSARTGLRFEVTTDDRPFYLDLFDNRNYLRAGFWAAPFTGPTRAHELYHLIRVVFVVLISIAALALILTPPLLRDGPPRTRRTASHLAFFFCLGTGFMVIEIVLMQRMSLLFDTPGLTIAVVLATLILFTGLGSLMSGWSFARGLRFRGAAALVVAYALCLHGGLDAAIGVMLGWSALAKGLAVAALLAPGALIMGHLFPQGLTVAARDDARLVPWAWGINGAMSTIAAGAAPLMAQGWGFGVLFLIGAGLYAVILVLPTCRRPATVVERTAVSARAEL